MVYNTIASRVYTLQTDRNFHIIIGLEGRSGSSFNAIVKLSPFSFSGVTFSPKNWFYLTEKFCDKIDRFYSNEYDGFFEKQLFENNYEFIMDNMKISFDPPEKEYRNIKITLLDNEQNHNIKPSTGKSIILFNYTWIGLKELIIITNEYLKHLAIIGNILESYFEKMVKIIFNNFVQDRERIGYPFTKENIEEYIIEHDKSLIEQILPQVNFVMTNDFAYLLCLEMIYLFNNILAEQVILFKMNLRQEGFQIKEIDILNNKK